MMPTPWGRIDWALADQFVDAAAVAAVAAAVVVAADLEPWVWRDATSTSTSTVPLL